MTVTCLKQCPPIEFRGDINYGDIALPGSIEPAAHKGPNLDRGVNPLQGIIYLGVVAAALAVRRLQHLFRRRCHRHPVTSYLPYLLLFVALLIALGFEFVNGFHDTANAVATVIYTHSLPANIAVVWSGMFNLFGVLLSTGAVAFGIVSLLPVELILQVGSSAGFAMVFALLIAAIIWNVGTWYFGLPASSSHTLIGSIIGVGITNALLRGRDGTSGVDWIAGRRHRQGAVAVAAVRLRPGRGPALHPQDGAAARTPALFGEPKGDQPPPWWIRGILILTCTLVSFFHGSNDGQKGMGLIMLILIGTVPTAYALNRALPDSQIAAFTANSTAASKVIEGKACRLQRDRQSAPGRDQLRRGAPDQRGHLSLAGGSGRATSASRSRNTDRSPRCPPTSSATPVTTCTSPPKRFAS